jgi:Fe2+ transport system protein FeoA
MSVSSPLFLSRKSLALTPSPAVARHLAPVQSIAEFSGGEYVRITAISGDSQLCHRLHAMGVFPGREVHILRKQGQSLLIKHGHMSLGIRLSPSFVIEAEEVG